MKKTFLLLALVCVLVLLAACGSKPAENTEVIDNA